MSSATTLVPLESLCCPDCGVIFAVPVVFLRQKDGDDIHCPNGHTACWPNYNDREEKDDPKVKELRRELVQAIHRAEQAEARNAPQEPADVIVPVDHYPAPCPCGNCLKHFKNARVLKNHLIRDHGFDDARALDLSMPRDLLRGRERESERREDAA